MENEKLNTWETPSVVDLNVELGTALTKVTNFDEITVGSTVYGPS